MNHSLEKLSRSAADSSGFPLQIRVADVVRSSMNWNVLVEEYPWQVTERGLEGFIDIVVVDAENEMQALVVECKRVRDTTWVFLIPKRNPKKRSYARLWLTDMDASRCNDFGWKNSNADPESYDSMFCAIPGSLQGRQTLIERSASYLIDSVEALAFNEKRGYSEQEFKRIYVPVIVTTAELTVSFFEPSSINLKDGSLPKDAVFETMPYVRFRKSFRDISLRDRTISIRDEYRESERTVFIVNAEHWETFLNQWELTAVR